MTFPRLRGVAAYSAITLSLAANPAAALNAFSSGVEIYDSDPATADLLVRDDVTIQGQLCIGLSCTWATTYSYDTMLKFASPDPNIEFTDTTSIPNHPTTDWRIEINEAGSGLLDRFSIRDKDAGTRPFTIEGGAPENALWVDDTGVIGLGTSLPGTSLHIVTGLQPAIRLEQDGSAHKTPGRWDVELRASDRAFAVRNADSGVSPVTVAYDSEAGALALANDAVGIGVSTGVPRAKLHIDLDPTDATYPYGLLLGDGAEGGPLPDLPGAMAHIISHQGNAQLKIEETTGTTSPRTLLNLQNNGRPDIVMANTHTGGEWSFGAGTNFILKQGAVGSASSAKTKLFKVTPSGDATLAGSLTTGGPTCSGGCDAVFDADYALPSITEHAAQMYALGHLPNVGPTKPGAAMNVTDKLGRVLNELETAHIFIARQQAQMARMQAEIDALKAARN